MKKRERIKKKGNKVILFPDLDKRLLEKGLERLQDKKYREAMELLTEAKEHNPDNEDIYIGLVLANFESGNLTEAKMLAREMLNTGIGEYFQIVDMYIMILNHQQNYSEIVSTIEALLDEREVPPEKVEHFTRILQISRKMEDEKIVQPEPQSHVEQEEYDQLDLFSFLEPSEQIQCAGKLANHNVRYYINEISEYLASENGDPFFKTMLLNVLKEQDYDKEITVRKFGREIAIIPQMLFDVHFHPDLIAISELVSATLEHDDPILLDSIKQLIDRYFFLLYPLRPEKEEPDAWAAAFHLVTLVYFGQEENPQDIANLYNTEEKAVNAAIEMIGMMEENYSQSC